MIQTHQGYFAEDGRFISNGLFVQLPVRKRAIINIIDEEVVEESSADREDMFRKLFAEIGKAESELTDEEWAELENARSRTNLGRTVEL